MQQNLCSVCSHFSIRSGMSGDRTCSCRGGSKQSGCLRHILVFGTACCGNRSGTDHKGGLQFPVCGNPGRSNLVFRRQFRSYRKPDFFRRNDQRAVLIQQRRYPGVPGNSWNHGVPDEPCWRICRIRTLGKHIKTRVGAELATILLGVLIFIDDYFNCLTVGSVMRPITDQHNVSRAKLAYLIDATAAPICIIAPISSWAAAVSGFVPGEDGMSVFVRAIPYNYYAILTIVMMVSMVLMKEEFGSMGVHESNALKGDLFTTAARPYASGEGEDPVNPRGKVMDLLIPIISLVICCVIGMIYTGGFFSGTDFVTAFSQSDASVGLVLGSFFGLVITILLYMVRKVLPFRDCMACIPEGFKSMVPAILILTFAWTLKSMTDSLGAAEFVAELVKSSADGLVNMLPAIIFIVACFLAFATGTSWGTFGILIPIVVHVFENTPGNLMIISISACMAGAVCGDHCSPISDTTIMASAGAQCDHVNHVSTQLPYAIVAAVVSFITYIFAGFIQSPLCLIIGVALMMGAMFVIKFKFSDLKNA